MPVRKKIFIAVGILLSVSALLLFPARKWTDDYFSRKIHAEIIRAVETRFNGRAELQDVEVKLSRCLQITGNKLNIWTSKNSDLPPLITINRFTLHTSLLKIRRRPIRIDFIQIDGLLIQVPAKQEKTPAVSKSKTIAQKITFASTTHGPPTTPKNLVFVVEKINADKALLKILPKKPGRDPLVFELHKVHLRSIGDGLPMQYDAVLKNAMPPGLVQTKGSFGPWNQDDPGSTAVSGDYTFQDADLSVFRGISGKLSSKGRFTGALRRIVADGTTVTPDFAVRSGKKKTHLTTEFHSIIDGTSGDTMLEPVIARFTKTTVVCNGGVVKKAGFRSKSVVLDVKIAEGRVVDLLNLVVPDRPPLLGNIRVNTMFDLPPGNEDVVKRLQLNGTFGLAKAEFTSDTVQDKIEELSRKSRGIHEPRHERIVSDLQGTFVLKRGSISFSHLQFSVPGASVRLAGNYGLLNEQIHFEGHLQMQAKLSQTQTGIKSILLKLADPFFKKGNAGAVVPIKITGTRKDPQFGLNFRKLK
jgi:hypothetical protein